MKHTLRWVATLVLTLPLLPPTAGRALVNGAPGQADAGPAVTLETLLQEMVDRDAAARWPEPAYVSKQASSYDRRSKTPGDADGWFANEDWSQFVRSEKRQGRVEWVMMDADGPGCVVRFWTGGKPATGTVRFYLDGADEPAVAGRLQDLLSGRDFVRPPLAVENPQQAGNLFLPIPFAKHCAITYQEADPKRPGGPPPERWYNIEYRTYPAGTRVKSFRMDDYKSAESLVQQVRAALTDARRPAEDGGKAYTLDQAIEPGRQATVDLPSGGGAVRSLEVRLENADAQALRSTVLRCEFDGAETVWCPVGDFFGSGVGRNVLESWNRRVTAAGAMRCRWVMPYRGSARLSLLNLGKRKVVTRLSAVVGPWKWDDRSMHFHANWRQQDPLPTQPRSDWNYLRATGKGVYVGDTLCVYNPVRDWWGEGDEKVRVDGEPFPSHFGTGTEDYYGYAWGDPRLFQSPFANQVRCDGPGNLGYTVDTRTRCLDAIPFTRSLQFDMEVWHWKDCKVGYAATTYWYALPGATSNRLPQPDEAARPLRERPAPFRLAHAVECEGMKIVSHSPDLPTSVQTAGLTEGRWSDDAQLFVCGRRPGDFIELSFPAKQKSKLTLYATRSWDYGVLRFSVNGERAGTDYDAWSEQAVASGPIPLGTFEPKDGTFVLRVEVVGANPKSKGSQSFFGLDAVTLSAP